MDEKCPVCGEDEHIFPYKRYSGYDPFSVGPVIVKDVVLEYAEPDSPCLTEDHRGIV